jgi:hypothetical protein
VGNISDADHKTTFKFILVNIYSLKDKFHPFLKDEMADVKNRER